MIKEALKQALVNIENSAKFSFNNHEEDNSMIMYLDDVNEFCEYLEEEQFYPIGIGINVPLTGYWQYNVDKYDDKVLGFLFHDLESDREKWIHIAEYTYERMMLWFYDRNIVKDKINIIKRG